VKIRVEISPLASKHQSGVAQYTRLLTEALAAHEASIVHGHYFNFLNRQPKPMLEASSVQTEPNISIPLRVYAKMHSYGFAPAFDILPPIKKRVDLTIFANFATWPALRTRWRATVIHDLTYLYFPEATEEKNLAHLKRVVPRSIKLADFIITVSETVKKELVKEFDLDPNLCVATPIPPDETFFRSVTANNISLVRQKYNLDKKYIYFIGNLEPRKNLSALIRAYCALPQNIKDTYSLVMAGGKGWKTEETQKILEAAQQAGDDVRHIGFFDQADSRATLLGEGQCR